MSHLVHGEGLSLGRFFELYGSGSRELEDDGGALAFAAALDFKFASKGVLTLLAHDECMPKPCPVVGLGGEAVSENLVEVLVLDADSVVGDG